MKRMNEKGISLPELLAAIVLTAIIGAISYMILFTGLKTSERVQVESQLRDEADLIMTHLIEDLYTLHTNDIEEKHLPEENTNNYYLVTKSDKILGFINGSVHYPSGEIVLNSRIQLDETKSKIIESSTGLLEITLVLTDEHTGQTLEVESNISVIRD